MSYPDCAPPVTQKRDLDIISLPFNLQVSTHGAAIVFLQVTTVYQFLHHGESKKKSMLTVLSLAAATQI